MSLSVKSLALASVILASHSVDPGYHMATEKEAKELVDTGNAEFNPEIKEGNKFAIRLTDKGIETVNTANNTGAAPVAAASAFAIITNAELPVAASSRGGGGRTGPVYPFDDLDIKQSFFVPATEERPEPAKSIASTATSAAKRHAVAVKDEAGNPVQEEYTVRGVTKTREKFEYTRRFKVLTVEEGKAYGEWVAPANGALVQRIA